MQIYELHPKLYFGCLSFPRRGRSGSFSHTNSLYFLFLFSVQMDGSRRLTGLCLETQKQLVSQAVCSSQLNFRKEGLFPKFFPVISAGVAVLQE